MAVQAQQPASNILQLSDWRNRLRQMIASGNRNIFSAVQSASPIQDAQTQLQISNAGATNPLLLFNAYHGQSMEQQQAQSSFLTGNEVELLALLGARKRLREGYELPLAHRHKASSIPVANALSNQATPPETTRGNCYNGLPLAFNDESSKTNMNPARAQQEVPIHYSALNRWLGSQMHQQKDEIDRYIELQAKQIKEVLEEQRRRQCATLLALVEEDVSKKFRGKNAEAVKLTRRNLELEDIVQQLSVQAHLWQSKAKTNEAVVSALTINLQQAEVQSKELIKRVEGCGDSEVGADNAASSSGGDNVDYQIQILQENKELKEQRSCRVCRSEEISMLLLPCRHLCLCKNCEGRLDVCPLCRSSKSASVHVYMS